MFPFNRPPATAGIGLLSVLAMGACLLEAPAASCQTIQDSQNFVLEQLYPGPGQSAPSMIAMAFGPGGVLYVGRKDGTILFFEPDSSQRASYASPTIFADLSASVEDSNERGLLGLALHPNFSSNRWIYAFYSYNGGQRLVRMTANATYDQISGAPLTLLEGLPNNASNHNAGDIRFSPVDGRLYLTLGDDTSTGQVQSLDTYNGKILRLADDGRGLSTNPHFNGDTNSVRSRIWGRGTRNPFRFTFHPGTGKIYVSENGDSTDRVSRWGAAGGNGGWPSGSEFNNPSDPKVKNLLLEQPSLTGIVIVRGGPFADPSAPGSDALYLANWSQGWIKRWRLTGNNLDGATPIKIQGSNSFVSGLDGIAHLTRGPDGAIYITTGTRSVGSGALYRLQTVPLDFSDGFESGNTNAWQKVQG